MNKQKNFSLLEIKMLLEPIGNVNYLIKDSILLIKKDDVVFGKINNDNIYLIDNTGTFKQIDPSILKGEDAFLKAATKSYWSASEKVTKSTY